MAYVYRGKIRDVDPVRNSSTPGPKPKPFDPAKCGTRAGYKQHKRKGVELCQPCRDAHAAYMAAYNARGRVPRTLQPCGTYAAYRRHEREGTKACAECNEANNAYQRKLTKDRDGAPKRTVAPLDPSACGTYPGYKRHIRRGQKPCPPCAGAQREYYRAYKATQQERRAA